MNVRGPFDLDGDDQPGPGVMSPVADGMSGVPIDVLVDLLIARLRPLTVGADGKDAYEIAVENGFVGDETAWLASLIGADGDVGPAGPVGINWRGEWDEEETYEITDGVYYDGSAYICIGAVTGNNPATDDDGWAVLAHSGADGADGAPGPDNVLDGEQVTLADLALGDLLQYVSPGQWENVTRAALGLTKSDVGLGSVTNDAQLKESQLDTDGALAANSDTRVASQKATKTYADTKQAASAILTTIASLTGLSSGQYLRTSGGVWALRTASQMVTDLAATAGWVFSQTVGFGSGVVLYFKDTGTQIVSSTTNTLLFKIASNTVITLSGSTITFASALRSLFIGGALLYGTQLNTLTQGLTTDHRTLDMATPGGISDTYTGVVTLGCYDDAFDPATLNGGNPCFVTFGSEVILITTSSGSGTVTATIGKRGCFGTTPAAINELDTGEYNNGFDGAEYNFICPAGLTVAKQTSLAVITNAAPTNVWLLPVSTINSLVAPVAGAIAMVEDGSGAASGSGPVRVRDWPSGTYVDETIDVDYAAFTVKYNSAALRWALVAKGF